MTGGSRFAQADKAMPDTRPKWGRLIRRRRERERGQSLIEFTLLMPLLLLVLLGMAEFGHALNSYLTVVAAARDSARLGAKFGVSGDSVGPQLMYNVIADETARLKGDPISNDNCGEGEGICIQSCVPSNNAKVKFTSACSGSGVDQDKHLSVRVCYEHPMIIGIPFFLQGPIDMCSHTTIRMQ